MLYKNHGFSHFSAIAVLTKVRSSWYNHLSVIEKLKFHPPYAANLSFIPVKGSAVIKI